MKILVPIKRVIDPYAKVKPLSDGSGLDLGDTKYDINPFDEIALEEAVRMRESGLEIEIVAVSIGKNDCEDQLRKALAMGADTAILVLTEDELDSKCVADELKALCEELSADIVLMGKQATDLDNNQAGQMLAGLMDWPQATFASKIEVGDGSLTVTRETDTGEEVLQIATPCVVTTDLRLNEPRFIALPGIIKARSKPLETVSRKTSSIPKTKTLHLASPPERSAGIKVNSVDELVSAIKDKGVL